MSDLYWRAVGRKADGTWERLGLSFSGPKEDQAGADEHVRMDVQSTLKYRPQLAEYVEVKAVNPADYRRLFWWGEFNGLEPLRQELYRALFPEINAPDFDPGTIKDVARLAGVALVKLHRLGLTETCRRCGGTGYHSRNQRDGSSCYGCFVAPREPGRGYVMPKLTPCLIEQVRKALAQTDTQSA